MVSGLWRARAAIAIALCGAASVVFGQTANAPAKQAAPAAQAPRPAQATQPAQTTPGAQVAPPAAQGGATQPAGAPEARVEFFSPRGTAKQVRQVSARFSAPMVALGDPRLADPFAVTCAASG